MYRAEYQYSMTDHCCGFQAVAMKRWENMFKQRQARNGSPRTDVDSEVSTPTSVPDSACATPTETPSETTVATESTKDTTPVPEETVEGAVVSHWQDVAHTGPALSRTQRGGSSILKSEGSSAQQQGASSAPHHHHHHHHHVKFEEEPSPAPSHIIHKASSPADRARSDRHFESLCSQYSTCYEVDIDLDSSDEELEEELEELDDSAAHIDVTVTGAGPASSTVANGRAALQHGASSHHHNLPAGFGSKRGMSIMLQRQQTFRPPPIAEVCVPVELDCHILDVIFIVCDGFQGDQAALADAVRNLERTNADLEFVVEQLQQTIAIHRRSIANNKVVIDSLRRLDENN
jgi:hypothetical protein